MMNPVRITRSANLTPLRSDLHVTTSFCSAPSGASSPINAGMTYVLHYAPDNASMIIRMALEHLGVAYDTALVDRSTQAQTSPAYLRINPNGLIPALETPDGTLFETGAILLWLTDRHGTIGPGPDAPGRPDFLKWLFFISNTVHPAVRMMFHPEKYTHGAASQSALRHGLQKVLVAQFQTLDTVAAQGHSWFGGTAPGALDFYIAAILRWLAIYPADTDRSWFSIRHYPHLHALCARLETLDCVRALDAAEGTGLRPFTDPMPANPPIGSAN